MLSGTIFRDLCALFQLEFFASSFFLEYFVYPGRPSCTQDSLGVPHCLQHPGMLSHTPAMICIFRGLGSKAAHKLEPK